ncbi:protein tirA-like [Haliotis rubra]|uniref:protein tirA-like n=1 Tax=Haliotis rubra TaxID=36100 RepID=UPI001EE51021|nr:protein tirA-like [Haliotis rubra]
MTAASQQKQEEVERGSASPDVFISYQWGKQKQIQLMYKRLTEMGFTVWMDIYQMGGGDSLFDKIDRGVRGAKVVLSCVTSKYSLSANCRREVSLADALKKPIVPLLLEKMTWPPSGPMSMVFTQLLYINFGKDETVQERWDGEKFDEMLTAIDQYVPNIILVGKGNSAISQQPQQPRHQQQPQQQQSYQQPQQQHPYRQPYQQPYQHQQVYSQRYPNTINPKRARHV